MKAGVWYIMRLTDHNVFDDYAAKQGWIYDNGGLYQDQRWDWYAGPTQGLVLMRQAPDRVVVVRYVELEPTELWCGNVSNTEEFDAMLNDVAGEIDASS